jgi:hypothetical protein
MKNLLGCIIILSAGYMSIHANSLHEKTADKIIYMSTPSKRKYPRHAEGFGTMNAADEAEEVIVYL